MESVLRDLWAGLQDAKQEVFERRRGHSLSGAQDADQTVQHSRVPWLVPCPIYMTHSYVSVSFWLLILSLSLVSLSPSLSLL